MATQIDLTEAQSHQPAPTVLPLPRARRDRGIEPRLHVLPRQNNWFLAVKSVFDFGMAIVLSIPAVPIVMLCALAVRLTSKGPAFYTQVRVGKDNRLFTIIKLRSMYFECESLTGPRWCIPGDPRVTPIGWLLRKTHLDELPQLINVLKGEMSLIGPRPERPEFVPDLERALPVYRQRLKVRPGVTGLAQVQLPPDTDVDSVRRKLAHDLYYIRNLSPWMDFRLLMGTALYALGMPFGTIGQLVGLPESEEIERSMRDIIAEPPGRQRMSA